MVQAAESRPGLNLASSPGADCWWPTCWRVLGEPEVRPILVVIAHVLSHQPLQMSLIQDDHVIQQISPATSNPTLSNTVLPRAAKCSAGWLAPHVPHHRNYIDSKL